MYGKNYHSIHNLNLFALAYSPKSFVVHNVIINVDSLQQKLDTVANKAVANTVCIRQQVAAPVRL